MSVNNNSTEVASEYRSVPSCQSTSSVSNAQKLNTQPKKMSFSGAVKASAFPRKEQAIIFPVIEGLQIRDYVVATGDLVDPKDILFASRMSNNRVCLYFSSKTIVNTFIEQHGGVEINDIFVPARKLILPAQRIILSNVSPCIPHEAIEENLKEKGLKLVSPISFIGAGIGIDKFRHVYSFRRQVFVAVDQTVEIPNSVSVVFEQEEYRIFLSDDKLRCFRCKEEGHIASNCLLPPPDFTIPGVSGKRSQPVMEGTSETTSLEVQRSVDLTEEPEVPDISQEDPDRLLYNTVSDPPAVARLSSQESDEIRPVSKKIKVDVKPERAESYEEMEKFWQGDNEKPIDFVNFSQFLKQVKGSNRPLEIARVYTQDINGLIELLKNVQAFISERSIKERCKRLIVSLKKALMKEGNPISSPPLSRSSSVSSLARSVSHETLDEDSSY